MLLDTHMLSLELRLRSSPITNIRPKAQGIVACISCFNFLFGLYTIQSLIHLDNNTPHSNLRLVDVNMDQLFGKHRIYYRAHGSSFFPYI